MSIFSRLSGGVSSALAGIKAAFTPKAPDPVAARRGIPQYPTRYPHRWWRSKVLTPDTRHKVANDKGLMIAENPLLRGLIARHFKEVA